ncbi:MAG: hypothetical protein ACM3PW_00595 [Chlamydiota bacterium]
MRLFVITIDTEADGDHSWTARVPESYENVTALQERLLPVVSRTGALPTLLLNSDIMARAGPSATCEYLHREWGWELGTHLHGELVNPQQTYASPAGHKFRELQCSYPEEIEFAKMAAITAQFRQRFGFSPASFRAGRWGAGGRTFRICAQLGYEADSSVVPGHIFYEGSAAADFTRFGPHPCLPASGGERLVEVPVTVRPGRWQRIVRVDPPGHGRGAAAAIAAGLGWRMRTQVSKLTASLRHTTWLRPSFSSAEKMISVLRWLKREEGRQPVIANMMFHSNEVLPGASPYTRSEADSAAYLSAVSQTLQAAKALSYEFATLRDAARAVSPLLEEYAEF